MAWRPLRRSAGKMPAGPTAKMAVLQTQLALSGQDPAEGGQKCLHLALFADGQAHVIRQCRK